MESSAESPLPVRTVALAIGGWVGRLGRVWVEGQITQLTRRPGQATCFLVLRDTAAEMSLQVAAPRSLVDALDPPLTEGGRVVVWAQPEFRPQRGTLSLTAYDVRPVGVGALLARLEQLRKTLAAEGLFAAERKRPLPFLPRTIGLVTGRGHAPPRARGRKTAGGAARRGGGGGARGGAPRPRRAVPDRERRGAGRLCRDRGHRGGAAARQGSRRRRHRRRPRRRLGRRPAAVLRR